MNMIDIYKLDTSDYTISNINMIDAIKNLDLDAKINSITDIDGELYISGLGFLTFCLGQENFYINIAPEKILHVKTGYAEFLQSLVTLGETINNNS